MRFAVVIAAAVIIGAFILFYLKTTQKSIDAVRDTTTFSGQTPIEGARSSVNQANEATERTKEQLEGVTGE